MKDGESDLPFTFHNIKVHFLGYPAIMRDFL